MESQKNCKNEQDINSECVKEDFYKWFESRGLLAELRAYMRQLMVKALEDSGKNSDPIVSRKAVSSPKIQAINLLLVDHLFHEDYLYTVSVFASEAHILDSLPQYSHYVEEAVRQHRCDRRCLPRFSRQETEDILDTLRLPSTQHDMQHTVELYLSGQESLLTCVAHTLASPQRPESSLRERIVLQSSNIELQGGYQLWSQEIQNLLLIAGVKLQHIQRMHHRWQLVIQQEKQSVREEVVKSQLIEREEWEQRIREELEEQLVTERSKLENRDTELNNLAQQLMEVREDISCKMDQAHEQCENLNERERQQQNEQQNIEQRLIEIEEREERLAAAEAGLAERTEEISSYHTKMIEQLHTQKSIQDASLQVCLSVLPQVVSTYTQTADIVVSHQQTSQSVEYDSILLQQMQMEREKISDLQEENVELRAHALQLRRRVNELTNRATSLTNQLQALHNAQEPATLQPPQTPLPVAIPPIVARPFFVPTYGFNSFQRQGAGEELLLNFQQQQQQTPPQQDGRRRASRYAFSTNPNVTSEESSPTDEVIQNARSRIQQLEAESAAVQSSFQSFHARLLRSDSAMFPPLGSQLRSADPLLRVRSEITSFTPFSPLPVHSQNNLHQLARDTESPEDEDDSSSDQAPFYNSRRNETLSNTRRLYMQRNIRHYERWKQFKKKFQRHRELNQDNQCFNTSTDDEDDICRVPLPRRRIETSKAKEVKKSHQKPSLEQNENYEFSALSNRRIRTLEEECSERNLLVSRRKENKLTQNNSHDRLMKKCSLKEKTASLSQEKATDKFNLEEKKSIELIESVKHLLKEKNPQHPAASNTNGSPTLESLPRDFNYKEDDEKNYPTTSVEQNSNYELSLTTKGVKRILDSERNLLRKKENKSALNSSPTLLTSRECAFKGNTATPIERMSTEEKLKLEEKQSLDLIENVKHLLNAQYSQNPAATSTDGSSTLESLPEEPDDIVLRGISISESILTVRKVESSNEGKIDQTNIKNENLCTIELSLSNNCQQEVNQETSRTSELHQDRIDGEANSHLPLNTPSVGLPPLSHCDSRFYTASRTPPRDVAEQDSLTSASDILRELNPTNNTSDSLVSTGFNDSQNSDFWN